MQIFVSSMKRSIQSLLRLPADGWRRSLMKSIVGLGPAKNASQDWSAGAIIRLRPTLVTSTWRTVFGNASALGMRTACVRFVVKTVERAILTLGCRGISRKDIRRLSPSVKSNVTLSKTNPSQNGDTHAGARRFRFRRRSGNSAQLSPAHGDKRRVRCEGVPSFPAEIDRNNELNLAQHASTCGALA